MSKAITADENVCQEASIIENGDGAPDLQTETLTNKEVEKLQSELTDEKIYSVGLQDKIKVLEEERRTLKNQVYLLEKEVTKCSLKPQNSDDNNDTLLKAKNIIFEKAKMCKNQELQIDALTQQVYSLKEIVAITKDMLEIRNMEVKQLQEKLECMSLKFNAEKTRHELMHLKLDKMLHMNADLKGEYQKQLELFNELQNSYQQRQEATERIETLKKED